VVTKGGMARPGGAWVPDGRARAIRSDCEASLTALGGIPIDLYLVHLPDPRVPWRTSVRALAKLVDEGLVAHVGVANVNRSQLDEALELAPIAAVQMALSVFDEGAVRGGVLERCEDAGITLIAHSPLGGPRRARGVTRRPELVELAREHDASPAEAALAWVLSRSPQVVAIPGARRPETVRSAVRAARMELHRPPSTGARPRGRAGAEVVLVMGIPGAGKSRIASQYAERGYVRLNRDERGGSLRDLADELDSQLGSGAPHVVLDNTYLTRAARSYVVDAAGRHGAAVRCLWLDTPLADAQVNLVQRLLDRFGALPTPEELRARARSEQGLLLPTSQMRAARELEPPVVEEGFAEVVRTPFVREPSSRSAAGVFVAAAALSAPGWDAGIASADPHAPHLVFDWREDGSVADLDPLVAQLSPAVSEPVAAALCPHSGGPPACWCRPPLPGLPLAFAREHGIDPAASFVVGCRPAHRTLAAALGARYVPTPD
jgi:predicted kinase